MLGLSTDLESLDIFCQCKNKRNLRKKDIIIFTRDINWAPLIISDVLPIYSCYLHLVISDYVSDYKLDISFPPFVFSLDFVRIGKEVFLVISALRRSISSSTTNLLNKSHSCFETTDQ